MVKARGGKAILTIAVGLAGTVLAGGAMAAALRSDSAPQPDLTATIRIAVQSSALSIDPITWTPGGSYQGFPAFDRLTTVVNGTVVPDLATKWSASKDGKSITFVLRKGVKFNDGTPVTAAAVAASVNRAKTAPGSVQSANLQGISSITAVNANTVRFNMSYGGAELPAIFATGAGAVINPTCIANGTKLAEPPANCTSSPWVVDTAKTVPPSDWWFTASPAEKNHFGGVGKAKELEVFNAGASTTALNGLLAGQLDVAHLTVDGIAQGKSEVAKGAAYGHAFGTGTVLSLNFNVHQAPFSNVLLRKAVYSAVNPSAINTGLFAGNCPVVNQPFIPGNWAHDSKFKSTLTYNQTQAKQYLAQAGDANGFSFTLSYYPLALFAEAAQVIQSQLAAVGIHAQLHQMSPGGPERAQGNFQAQVLLIGAVIDPAQQANDWFQVGGVRVAWPAVGSDVESQLNKLRYHAVDPRLTLAQRRAVYNNMWKIVNNQEAWEVPICSEGVMFVHNKQTLGTDSPQFRFMNGYIDARYLYKAKQ